MPSSAGFASDEAKPAKHCGRTLGLSDLRCEAGVLFLFKDKQL